MIIHGFRFLCFLNFKVYIIQVKFYYLTQITHIYKSRILFNQAYLILNMNAFIDTILNPSSVSKRKSLSEKNSQINKKKQSQIQKQQLKQLDEKRNPSQYQNQNDEFEVEQIEEQVIFDNEENGGNYKTIHHNIKNSHSLPHPSYYEQDPQAQTPYLNQIEVQHFEETNNQKYYSQISPYRKQSQPILMSNSQNQEIIAKGFNPRSTQNLINEINSARQVHNQFLQWFSGERQQFRRLFQNNLFDIKQRIQLTIQEQRLSKNNSNTGVSANQISKGPSQANPLSASQSLSMQRKWQIQKKLIKQQLEQRYQYRIEKLQQQLEQQRKFSQEQLNYLTNNNFQQPNSAMRQNSKELVQELSFVRKQLESKQGLIQQLQMENQKLNQHIFDIEQQIEGIQLEVQTRLRTKLKQFQDTNVKDNLINKSPDDSLQPILEASVNLQQSSKMFGVQSMNIRNQHLQQLRQQNQYLKEMIKKFKQQKTSIGQQLRQKQVQLQQKQKIIKFRQQQIKKNQQDIDYQWGEIQRQRQSVLLRQQQLTTAENNISRKISEIRSKQAELDKWQIQLTNQQNDFNFKDIQIKKKFQELIDQQNQIKIIRDNLIRQEKQSLKLDRQNILKPQRQSLNNLGSIGIRSKKNIHDLYTDGGGSFRQNGVQIPDLPIGRKYHPDFSEKSLQNQYQFKNRQVLKQNFQRSFQEDKSYGRLKDREKMAVTSSNFRSGRGNQNVHQYILPQTSKLPGHSRSKSRSKQKNLIRNFNTTNNMSSGLKGTGFKGSKYMQEMYQNKNNSNLDGLGSKLQRLRDQIKRQIDSIK